MLDYALQLPHVPQNHPENERNFEVHEVTPIDSSEYFKGISKRDRQVNRELLNLDADLWLSQIPGIDKDTLLISLQREGKMDNGGVLRASIDLAEIINSGSRVALLKKEVEGEEEKIPITEEDYDDLIKTAPSEGLGLLVQLMRDIYFTRDLTGFTVLQARKPEHARDVMTHGTKADKAIFCGRAEGYFMSFDSGLHPIEINGEVLAYRKTKGENTAILVQDSVLNGVLIPKGSIMTVKEGTDGTFSFSFGRLSAFSVSSPEEIEAMAPDLSKENNFFEESSRYNKIRRLLNSQLTFPTEEDLKDYISNVEASIADNPQIRRLVGTLNNAIIRLKEEQEEFEVFIEHEYGSMNEKYPFRFHSRDMTEQQKLEAKEAQEIRERERARIRSISHSMKNPKVAYRNKVTMLIRTYGQKAVNEARGLIREKAAAQRVIDNMEQKAIHNVAT
jgi:hypothetical protein